jgi:hypothetical protein
MEDETLRALRPDNVFLSEAARDALAESGEPLEGFVARLARRVTLDHPDAADVEGVSLNLGPMPCLHIFLTERGGDPHTVVLTLDEHIAELKAASRGEFTPGDLRQAIELSDIRQVRRMLAVLTGSSAA